MKYQNCHTYNMSHENFTYFKWLFPTQIPSIDDKFVMIESQIVINVTWISRINTPPVQSPHSFMEFVLHTIQESLETSLTLIMQRFHTLKTRLFWVNHVSKNTLKMTFSHLKTHQNSIVHIENCVLHENT